MWSLFKNKKDDSEGGIFDYSTSGECLTPLKFSNGKTQEDVVKEILSEIEKGAKVIFVHGLCGTGKSAIALNLARHYKKTSIVVPIKSLQEQYEEDYTNKNFILKKDTNKMRISVIKGRNNFRCPFSGERCDDETLPCSIELREKNIEQIKEYIDMNPAVEKFDFSSVSDVRRMSVAPACPYWSPLLPAEVSVQCLEKAKKFKYPAISGKEFALFQRKKGCGYYDQYEAYANSDVLIFNSQKYFLETMIGRKPKTDLDIIDECDEFLDNFANERRINLNRLLMALSNLFPEDREQKEVIKEMIFMINSLIYDEDSVEIEKIGDTKLLALIEKALKFPYLADEEEGNYYNTFFEIAKSFEHLLDETYISFERTAKDDRKTLFGIKKEETVSVDIVSINLAERFKEIIDSNNVLVLMSGTLHSEQVLKDIFGLKEFKIIEAETKNPGTVTKYRTGLEKNCKYENFKNGIITRKQYLKAMDVCMANATPPVLVHVSAFSDLPSEEEQREYKFDNLITQERLREIQMQDRSNRLVDEFKSGEEDVLFTTKCSRGVDFAGDKCNSIVITKYPYPNIQGLFWKILKKEQPNKFMEFYLDKARRDLIQKVARGVRFKGDHVLLLSPDVRVLNEKFDV